MHKYFVSGLHCVANKMKKDDDISTHKLNLTFSCYENGPSLKTSDLVNDLWKKNLTSATISALCTSCHILMLSYNVRAKVKLMSSYATKVGEQPLVWIYIEFFFSA